MKFGWRQPGRFWNGLNEVRPRRPEQWVTGSLEFLEDQ